MSEIFFREIKSKNRKPLKLILLVGHGQAYPAEVKLTKAY